MATHCLSPKGLLRCGWQEGFWQTGEGLVVAQEGGSGLFVSQVYDSGREGTQWDRILLDIAEKAAIEVHVWLFDNIEEKDREPWGEDLRGWYEWQKENERSYAQYCSNYRSMLLYGSGGGRYARLAVEIQPGDEEDTLFGGFDMSFPKESFTRYLPAIYQDNPLLERFLAVQEEIYMSLEREVDSLAAMLDYEADGRQQIVRLARWMGWEEMADEAVGEDLLIKLLRTGIDLTGRKGTCAYYTKLTEILTGSKTVMVEEPEKHRAVVLVLEEPKGEWERYREWLKRNTAIGIDVDFVVLHKTDRLDNRCFLDHTSRLAGYEPELSDGGYPLNYVRLL